MGLENNKLVRRFIKFDEKTPGSSSFSITIGMVAAFGGILFGYDIGTISGIMAMPWVLEHFPKDQPAHDGIPGSFSSEENSLIVAILSVGTFFGALGAPFLSDTLGRRWSLIIGTFVFFNAGIIIQTASTDITLLCVGRTIAGVGVGVVSAVVPLYQAETVPKWIRGAVTGAYQLAIALGLLLAACFNQATHAVNSTASYRFPIAIQFLWSLIITISMIFMPETPRFFVSKGRNAEAAKSLARIRRLSVDHPALIDELGEIEANFEFEQTFGQAGWTDCFKTGNSQLKRLATGMGCQMFQQLSGNNFIFYFGTTFFKNSGIKNSFLISVATGVVMFGMTVPGIIFVETAGRRILLLIGAAGMASCQLIIAIVGTTSDSDSANKCLVAFTCLCIAFYATTWAPVCWVIVGEIFPLRTRGKSVALSTSCNWLWNFAIAYATPYLVDKKPGSAGLESKVFFIWGGFNVINFFFAYTMVYETKGLTLEQMDELYEKIPHAWQSKSFVPTDHKYTNALHEGVGTTDYELEDVSFQKPGTEFQEHQTVS